MAIGKVKVHHRTDHKSPGRKYRYISTLSLTSVINGVDGQCHALAVLPSAKIRVIQEAEGAENLAQQSYNQWTIRK
jgi:hypothetical protein